MSYHPIFDLPNESEQDAILSRFVDALWESKEQLLDAEADEWDRVVRASCRELKLWSSDNHVTEPELAAC